MTKAHLWYVIDIGQGCWLDNEETPLGCHWVDDKGLTQASHCYARLVTRWLEILASYTRQLNLTMITSGMVLEQLRAR